MRSRRYRRAAGVLAATLWAATPAHADDEASPLAVRLERVDTSAAASFDVTPAFTEAFRQRLRNGLTSRIAIEMRLIGPDDRPIASTSRRCTFQFDIWDELLEVRIHEGNRLRAVHARQRIDVGLEDCGVVVGAKLAPTSLLTRRFGYTVEVLVQLNPVSEEQLQRAREFMANPRSNRTSRPRSFFGAVASFFGAGPAVLDDEFLFRSAALGRPARRER
jgi:hypothetical protein